MGLRAEWGQPTASAFSSWTVSAWARTHGPSQLQAAPIYLERRLAMLLSVNSGKFNPLLSVVSSGLWVDEGGDRTRRGAGGCNNKCVTTSVTLWHSDRLPEKVPPSMRPCKCSDVRPPPRRGRRVRVLTCLVTSLRSVMGSLPVCGVLLPQALSFLWPANVGCSFVGYVK